MPDVQLHAHTDCGYRNRTGGHEGNRVAGGDDRVETLCFAGHAQTPQHHPRIPDSASERNLTAKLPFFCTGGL